MFTGQAICTIDPKSRVIIPSRFRKYIKTEAENKLIITRGLDGCLLVYPNDVWEKVQIKLSKMNVFDPEQRFFLREFLSYVNICEIDSQNRILLPQKLIEYANLKKEILLLGLLDKMEIWDPEIKLSYDSKQDTPFEVVAKIVTQDINNVDS